MFDGKEMGSYFSAAEAAAFLGISKATLYAYVSRDLVRSEAGIGPRGRRYNRLDLEALRRRKRIRHQPQTEMADALNWGAPLLDSALTLILDGRLYYRGVEVDELVSRHSFWEVARWFWTGAWDHPIPVPAFIIESSQNDPLAVFHGFLIEQAALDPLGYDVSPAAVAETGTKILHQFLALLSRRNDCDLAEAGHVLEEAWAPDEPGAARIFDAVLILCIDHELNASSFTARVVASAGCSLYETISAALCALHGARHGGDTIHASFLLEELLAAKSARPLIMQRIRTGKGIPGFGHRLYPDGDPRAEHLFRLLREVSPVKMKPVDQCLSAVASMLKKKPTIDLALAVVGRIYGLPQEAPFELFALGRAVGWIAHAAEQGKSQQIIRPRARYIGPMPGVTRR